MAAKPLSAISPDCVMAALKLQAPFNLNYFEARAGI